MLEVPVCKGVLPDKYHRVHDYITDLLPDRSGGAPTSVMLYLAFLGYLYLASCVSALTYKGADISSVPVVEQTLHYTDNGAQTAFETIIKVYVVSSHS